MPLNTQTIILMIAVSSTLNVLMLLAQYLLSNKFNGLKYWVTAYACFAVSQYINYFHTEYYKAYFVIFSDITVVIGFIFVLIGLREFLELKFSKAIKYGYLAVAVIFCPLYFIHHNDRLEQAGILFLMGLSCIIVFLDLLKKYHHDKNLAAAFIAYFFLIYGIIFWIQSGIDFYNVNTPFDSLGGIMPIVFLASFIMSTIAMFCFVLLLNQQLIAQLSKSQNALNTNQEILLTAQEVAQMGSYIFDIKSCKWTVSPAMKSIYGLEDNFSDDRQNWLELVAPEHKEMMLSSFNQIILTGVGLHIDYKIIRANDKLERWIFGSAKRQDDEFGNPIRILGTIQDITERKRQEQALREAKNHFEIFFESSPDAVLISRLPGGNIINVNKAFERLACISREKAIGMTTLTLNLWKYNEDRIKFLEILKEKGSCPNFEGYFINYKGQTRYCVVSGSVFTIDGAPHIISITRDITEQRQNEKAIEESAETFSKIFYSNPSICTINDPISRAIIDVNYAFTELLGYTAEEAIGKTVEGLGIVDETESINLKNNRAEDGNLHNVELALKSKDGKKRVVLLSSEEVFLVNKHYTYTVAYDITERKLQEDAMELLRQQLQTRADELDVINKELEQFAYIASHDLQEPLRMIQSFLQLIQKRYGKSLDSSGQQYIQFAVDGATKMKGTILDLLEYSRTGNEDAKSEIIDMGQLVAETIQMHQVSIKECNAVIKWENLPIVHGAKVHLQQIFNNLIGNAIKYKTPNTAPLINISATEEKGFWKFAIQDNGIGIAPQFQHKIFVVFRRLHHHDEYSGNGIGLSICKKLVEKKGGRIWVESDGTNGSTFYFTIRK